MTALLVALAGGTLAGLLLTDSTRSRRVTSACVTAFVFAVVGAQGLALGRLEEFDRVWLLAVGDAAILAVAASSGAALAAVAASRVGGRLHLQVHPTVGAVAGDDGEEPDAAGAGDLVPWLLVATLIAATLAGRASSSIDLPAPDISTWALRGLLAAIGLDVGRDRRRVASRLRRARMAAWVVPTSLAGSMSAALLVSPWTDVSVAADVATAVGSGFYSVTGPIVAELENPYAGTVAFLANLLRELLAMLVIPVLARRGANAGVGAAIGGATAMDSNLPFLQRGWGLEGAIVGLSVGLVLSLAVPPLVPLVHALFSAHVAAGG